MDRSWAEIDGRLIEAGEGPVIVWHVYNGAMVVKREYAIENSFFSHWREIDNEAWIDARKRKPTRDDADEYGCVLSQNKWGEASVAGWHRFEREPYLVAWQHMPDPPDNYRELRKRPF